MLKMLRSHTKLLNALVLALLAIAFVVFAPVQIGGAASFVIINGNSMEPLYYRGDLVIARTAPAYQVGDIVIYRHPTIGPVIHRIIGHAGDAWVFKGDNNHFIDPYQPVQNDLIGKAWIHIPSIGKALDYLRTPLARIIISLGLGAIIMTTITGSAPQPKRAQRRQPHAAPRPANSASSMNEGALSLLTLIAVAAIALGVFAFTRPLVRATSEDLSYQQRGAFRYAAAAPSGVYDTAQAQTGQPVFLKLTDALTAEFSYQFVADQEADLHGSMQLNAELSADNGWKRTLALHPPQAFSGDRASIQGTIDLRQVQQLIEQLEQQTEVEQREYQLAIMPDVTLDGTLADQPLHERFAPQMNFRLNNLQIQLAKASDASKDPLKPMQAGMLKRTQEQPNTIGLFGMELAVTTARRIALSVLALTLAGMALIGVPPLLAARRAESARIAMRYGAQMIDVASSEIANVPMIQAATIADLAKLAEKHGAVILHECSRNHHRYIVHADTLTYCYTLQETDQSTTAPAQRPSSAMERLTGRFRPAGRTPAKQPAHAEAAPVPAAPWYEPFLATLREKGLTSEACRAAGIGIVTAYHERDRAPAFARAWNEAQAYAQQQRLQKERAA